MFGTSINTAASLMQIIVAITFQFFSEKCSAISLPSPPEAPVMSIVLIFGWFLGFQIYSILDTKPKNDVI